MLLSSGKIAVGEEVGVGEGEGVGEIVGVGVKGEGRKGVFVGRGS
jgi:hypothetical protein